LLVVDDHGIVREGLMAMLRAVAGVSILGSAGSGDEAVSEARRLNPSIVIMDLFLPDMSGIAATQRLLEILPQVRVIMFSACHTTEHVYQALRAGAYGYIVKDALCAELVRAVLAVKEGRQFLSPEVAAAMASESTRSAQDKSPIERLSGRERDVLSRIIAGASSAAIAKSLSLSPKTIDTYRGRLMMKLGVGNRSALIRFAIENGLTR
jgi:DNA-binding NarL/FixJ family response regulator